MILQNVQLMVDFIPGMKQCDLNTELLIGMKKQLILFVENFDPDGIFEIFLVSFDQLDGNEMN